MLGVIYTKKMLSFNFKVIDHASIHLHVSIQLLNLPWNPAPFKKVLKVYFVYKYLVNMMLYLF